jgi:excinuclease ABC subunit A
LLVARELSKSTAGPTLYLLDEPTAGLHAVEVARLLSTLRKLSAAGHTVVVIEHHLSLLRCVDWLMELGPGAGAAGGRIIAAGPPAEIATGDTPTARALQSLSSAASRANGVEPSAITA